MQLSDYPRVTTYLSNARLQKYKDHAPPNCRNRDEYAWRVYLWNIEVSSSFWGPIGILEVALRNSFADILVDEFGTSWWRTSPNILPQHSRWVEEELRKLEARSPENAFTSDDVVGIMPFGFWSALTDQGRSRHPELDYNAQLWTPYLSHAFPYLEKPAQSRKRVHGILNDIRKFRNRIAHREPIVLRHSLRHQFEQVLEVCAWIDPSLKHLIEDTSSVRAAIARKSDCINHGDYRI